ncbi:hypothetical protein KLEP7_gp11 [Pseudaeromonas phage vB_PpeM_ KLEP7]|nr:hypothetical protein KLEP7_gp11 [Pseudaeromonas phage vB_PpeM_ KLEP7]
MSYKDTFLEKALELHGDKYDYTSVDYVNSKVKVIIICKIHGEFLQTPNCHLMGQGCPSCALDRKRDRISKTRFTTESFVEKAEVVHGNLYDYSKVIYRAYHEKVTILCRKHGGFNQAPAEHLSGSGCKYCHHEKLSKIKKLSKEYVINLAENKYPDYDFSEAQYNGTSSLAKIKCNIHGIVDVRWSSILFDNSKYCCPKCNDKRLSIQEFKDKAVTIHKDKYDYSSAEYSSMSDKVDIICPIHGVFKQTAHIHLKGRGCQECGGTHNTGTEGFVIRAKSKYGDTYDYSLVNYINRKTPVDIVCREHGVFSMAPMTHLRADIGCARCSRAAMGETRKLTQEDFLEKTKRHENLDLSSVTYTKAYDDVIVICKEHGEFKTKFTTLLYGSQPCRACRKYNYTYNSGSVGYFYINAVVTKDENIYMKFGVSFSPEQRFKQFMKKNKNSVKDLITLDIFEFETLHKAYLFEKYVKANLNYTQIFDKESMRDGFTEICDLSLYNNILQLRRHFV